MSQYKKFDRVFRDTRHGVSNDKEQLREVQPIFWDLMGFLETECPKLVEIQYPSHYREPRLCQKYFPTPENENERIRWSYDTQSALQKRVCEKAERNGTKNSDRNLIELCDHSGNNEDVRYIMSTYLEQ